MPFNPSTLTLTLKPDCEEEMVRARDIESDSESTCWKMIDLASRDCVCLLSDLILSSKERERVRGREQKREVTFCLLERV